MANPIPEIKEDTQISANAEGAPTPAETTPLTNEQATVGALEVQKDLTSDAVTDAAEEKTLEDTPDIKIVESKEAVPPDVPEEVKDFITPASEHLDAKQTQDTLEGTGEVVGETHPAHNLGQTLGEFNTQTVGESPKESSKISDFNALDSRKYGRGEGKPLNEAVKGRWKILKWAKIPKLFGGTKVETIMLESPPPPETAPVQERKAA